MNREKKSGGGTKLKRARVFLKLLLFAELGGLLGYALRQYLHYRKNPELYEVNSAPWYTGILLWGVLTAAAAALTLAAYLILGAAIRKQEGCDAAADGKDLKKEDD